MAILLAVLLGGVSFIFLVVHPGAQEYRDHALTLGFGIVFLAITAGGAGVYRALSLQREQWASFRLVLEGDALTRHVAKLPPLTFRREELTRLEEIAGAGLVLRSRSQGAVLVVPVALVGYGELRAALADWRDIESTSFKRAAARGWTKLLGIAGGVLLAFGIVIGVNDARIVTPVGAIVVGILLWSHVSIRRNPQIDERTKPRAWLILLPVLSIVGIVAVKIAVAMRAR